MHSEQLDTVQTLADAEMALEALDASCIAADDVTGAQSQDQNAIKDHSKTKKNYGWKQKIRATFPLFFVKHFQRSWSSDKAGPETVPEVDSDFEEITATENLTNSEGNCRTSAGSQHPSQENERSETHSATTKPVSKSSSPKKRLILSIAEKEKLLNWDILLTPEENPICTDPETTQQLQDQVPAEADKPETDSGQDREAAQSQTFASSPLALQFIANAFRRAFTVTNPSSNTSSAVIMRSKPSGPRKQRPMSEGALNMNSLFSAPGPEPGREKKARKREAGLDLPSLLQQVSIKSRRDSGGVFSDDMTSLSNRRVNLFSSLRLKKTELSDREGTDQEAQKKIRTILTNLRNKASSLQSLDEPCSSDDENDNTSSTQRLCSERQRRKQEKTVAQQTRREELKRLHRAQAIQRQLEEVGEKQRDLEERGVAIEKLLRGETEEHQADNGDDTQLYQSWFKLVLEKNRLARYESELTIFAQELELEDTQSRLQQDLRRRMATEDTNKSASELQKEQEILSELMRTVEKRDMLVSVLEEQRLKEKAEDRDLESLVLSKGYEFHWAQVEDSWGSEEVGRVDREGHKVIGCLETTLV